MKYLMIALFLCAQTVSYKDFLNFFPKAKYDQYGNYLTRTLNVNSYIDLKEKYTLVTDNESFKFLCNNDSSKFFYQYDLYHMEKGHLIKVVKNKYNHYAITSFQADNFDMILYSKYDSDNERFYLKSFNKEGKPIDELLTNEIIYEGTSADIDKFRFSLISPKSIKVFKYYDVKNPNDKEKTSFITKVVIESYSINNYGRFKKMTEDSVLLSKSMRAYTKFNTEPQVDDPIYKYWTLW